jgi:hypothetical protein
VPSTGCGVGSDVVAGGGARGSSGGRTYSISARGGVSDFAGEGPRSSATREGGSKPPVEADGVAGSGADGSTGGAGDASTDPVGSGSGVRGSLLSTRDASPFRSPGETGSGVSGSADETSAGSGSGIELGTSSNLGTGPGTSGPPAVASIGTSGGAFGSEGGFGGSTDPPPGLNSDGTGGAAQGGRISEGSGAGPGSDGETSGGSMDGAGNSGVTSVSGPSVSSYGVTVGRGASNEDAGGSPSPAVRFSWSIPLGAGERDSDGESGSDPRDTSGVGTSSGASGVRGISPNGIASIESWSDVRFSESPIATGETCDVTKCRPLESIWLGSGTG